MTVNQKICTAAKKCGGCCYQGVPYQEQLKKKQRQAEALLESFGRVEPVIGMKDPFYYRNKVHHAFARTRRGEIISGIYEEDSHRVVPVEDCLIEDRKSQEIIRSIHSMLRSFKIRIYDEDTGQGLLRHVLVRRGFSTGEIMVVLVMASPLFPSRNHFVKALRERHPEITTVIQNINDKRTSMVLGERNITLYGKGWIRETICGYTFRLSPDAFMQVNPVQTEVLYSEALKAAQLSGTETILDTYCGIGTIGIIASSRAEKVIGAELNPNAVKDALQNARENKVTNIEFRRADAGKFMEALLPAGERPDLVIMDPPRAGSDRRFLGSLVKLGPPKVVYISCNPETLARDLRYLREKGYRIQKLQPVDMFPFTSGLEVIALLHKTRPRYEKEKKNRTKEEIPE